MLTLTDALTYRRHVMNISFAKVGMAMYAWTAWFGKRSHAGSVYADEVKRLVGDGEGIISCCADNTSSRKCGEKCPIYKTEFRINVPGEFFF